MYKLSIVSSLAFVLINQCSYGMEIDIFTAACSGNLARMQELIAAGADVNQQEVISRFTPLHRAVTSEQPEIVQLLIAARANGDLQDDNGLTPLHWAVNFNYTNIAQMLIAAGADVNKQNHRGETPLLYAVYDGNADMVQILIDSGADLNKQNLDGFTPLHMATVLYRPTHIHFIFAQIVQMLITSGAYINLKNKGGLTALDLAQLNEKALIITLIRDYQKHIVENLAIAIEADDDCLGEGSSLYPLLHELWMEVAENLQQ